MNQTEYLCSGDAEDERTLNTRDVVEKHGIEYHLFLDNPLKENCYLHSIIFEESKYFYACSVVCSVYPCRRAQLH